MKLRSILWQLSGVDENILAQCPPKWQRKYMRGAIGMLVIGLTCAVSGAYTFWVIFGNAIFALPFSLIWATVIVNLYRLVLITVGNPHIPHAPRYRFPFGSFLFRTMFIAVLGLFVVKPVEMLIFSPAIQPHLEAHRAQVLAAHEARTQQFAQAEVREIFQTGNLARELTDESGYLMTRLEILHREYPGTWALTALLLWVFVWPFWARVAWRKASAYEQTRGAIEHEVVLVEYRAFRTLFTTHMLALTGRDDIWEERFHDMPFGNQPIRRAEQDYMVRGSLYGYARVWASDQLKDQGGAP